MAVVLKGEELERELRGREPLTGSIKLRERDSESEAVYTSFFGHSDFVGTAVSFIKYDNVTSTFNVVDAYFELGDIV